MIKIVILSNLSTDLRAQIMMADVRETYWSRFQSTYDDNQEYVVGKDLLDTIKENLKNLPDLGATLELGCGTGYFTEIVVLKARQVFATDLSEELLENARRRLSNIENITFQKENCLSTSFASNTFDTVFMANVIHVIKNPLQAIQECNRVLKENGLLIVTSFTNHGMTLSEKIKLGFRFIKVWGKPPRHTHAFSPDRLGSLLESAGFSIEKSQLLGEKTKSLYLIGKKSPSAQ